MISCAREVTLSTDRVSCLIPSESREKTFQLKTGGVKDLSTLAQSRRPVCQSRAVPAQQGWQQEDFRENHPESTLPPPRGGGRKRDRQPPRPPRSLMR